nr:MAG TPA: hypothetical protein [Caudoviricetes sp.]
MDINYNIDYISPICHLLLFFLIHLYVTKMIH